MKLAIHLPHVHRHPNRLPFRGVLAMVDEVSDAAPTGALGHRVVLRRKAAIDALPSLMGMAVNFKAGLDGHNQQQKCGVITAAHISGNQLRVSGFLYANDFKDVVHEIAVNGDELGMSFDIADAHIENMRADVWWIERATFTGAAILLKRKAAYKSTSFEAGRRTQPSARSKRACTIAAVCE